VFQAGGQNVAVVEVHNDEYLASVVPLIVNAVLNEHQVVVDVITFVARGDFPRSRLGEKQRGKILSHWVTRKLRTIEQFTVRGPEDEPRPLSMPDQPEGLNGNSPLGITRVPSDRRLLPSEDVVIYERPTHARRESAGTTKSRKN